VHAELRIDPLRRRGDRVGAQTKAPRDGGTRFAAREQPRDLELPLRQDADRAALAALDEVPTTFGDDPYGA
jgi:hypothetical protein